MESDSGEVQVVENDVPNGEGLRGPRVCRRKKSRLATSYGLQRGQTRTAVGKLREIGWRLHTQGLEYMINEEKIKEVKPASRILNLKEYLLNYLTPQMEKDD